MIQYKTIAPSAVVHGVSHPQMVRRRDGFALVAALLVIAFITIAAAAGFILVSSERRTADDQSQQVIALGIAQQGIEAYIRHPENAAFRPGRTVHLPPLNYDTAWVPVNPATGDTAVVIVRLLHASTASTGDTMYVLSALGMRAMQGVKGTPPARRAVAEIMTWSGGATVPLKAGWLSLSGVTKNGASGTLSGIDASSPPCLSGGNVAGVTVPKTIPNGAGTTSGYTGSTTPLSGNPPLDTTSLGSSPSAAGDSLSKTGLDWAEWSQGLNLPNVWRTSDHGGSFPSFTDPTYYPIVYVNGDVPNLPNGRGLLVVSGSLTMNGNTQWSGIVLVGGSVTANGNDNVQGAVLSGLNLMIDTTSVGVASLGNGTKTIEYNSCEVKKALSGTRALIPRRGTWTDNWKTY